MRAWVLVLTGCGRLGFGEVTPPGDSIGDDAATARVAINVTLAGDGVGTVTSDPPGIVCGDTCSMTVAPGTPVVLTTSHAETQSFQGWNGACHGLRCDLAPTVDTDVEAVFFGPRNRVFVTSTGLSVVGLTQSIADAECNNRAAAQGIGGTFRAWLSTTTAPARDRLGTARGWLRLDDRPFADTIADLTTQAVLFPARFDETGAKAESYVSGTGSDGGGTDADTCGDYTGTVNSYMIGRPDSTGGSFTASVRVAPCAGAVRQVLCFGIDIDLPVTVVPAEGPLAFVTPQWDQSKGIADADLTCQTAAQLAGKTGSFRALLATSTATAASRFSVVGQPWVLPNGLPILAERADLVNRSDFLTGITQRADGTYGVIEFWLGAADRNTIGTTATTCNDWSSTTATGQEGFSSSADQDFTRPVTCAPNSDGLICLQD